MKLPPKSKPGSEYLLSRSGKRSKNHSAAHTAFPRGKILLAGPAGDTRRSPSRVSIPNLTGRCAKRSTASFVAGDGYAEFIGAILPNTPAGRLFLLIHELGHLSPAERFRPGTGNNNQPKQKME